jgi:A118 family predicted phage portal protein
MDAYTILEKQGFNLVPAFYYSKISEWLQIYQGVYDRGYTVYNGAQATAREYRTLGLPKKICEDKADLLVNEKLEITTGDAEAQAIIGEALSANNFIQTANRLIETSSALGTGALIVTAEGGDIKINAAQAYNIFPLSWDGDNVTECAFAGKIGGCAYLQKHLLEDGAYAVYNELYDKNGVQRQLNGVEPRFETKSPTPLFALVKPNLCNNVPGAENVPLGLSVFENLKDIIKGADITYDSLVNEFVLGKKRIFINDELIKSKALNGRPVFDSRDVVFYGLDVESGGPALTESNMELRTEEHERGLQMILDILSDCAGFGTGYYNYSSADTTPKTATEVISQNSKLYKRIKKDEIIIRDAIISVCKAILTLSGLPGERINKLEISVQFDDSIIEDANAVANRALIEYNAGIIGKTQYFMITRGLDEASAAALAKAADDSALGGADE